jgi:hypothetical protein
MLVVAYTEPVGLPGAAVSVGAYNADELTAPVVFDTETAKQYPSPVVKPVRACEVVV